MEGLASDSAQALEMHNEGVGHGRTCDLSG